MPIVSLIIPKYPGSVKSESGKKMAVSGFLLYNCHNNHIMKGNEAGACAAPKPRTRTVTALDPHLRLLLALLTKLGFRCCLEERGSRASPVAGISSAVRSGETSNVRCADLRRLSLRKEPPTRMQSIRGKPGNNPQGKASFSLRDFPGFLGPEALKLFVTPAQQAEAVGLSQRRYFARCGSRGIIPLVGVWGA